METTWDKVRAVLFALCVHAFALALLFIGLWWQPAPAAADAEGPMIEATLVSSPQQSAAVAKAIQKAAQQQDAPPPPPQPKPEPKPQDAPQPPQVAPQAPLPKPDTVNQDEVRRVADEAAAQQLKEQEERRKQAQIDLTNQQQQQQEEQNRQRLSQQELDRQKQLDAIRKQRAAAERQVQLEAQKLKQLQDQRAGLAQNDTPPAPKAVQPSQPPGGNNGKDTGLLVKYQKAIRDVIHQNWHTANVPQNTHCNVQVKQLPGGEVFDVTFLPGCPFDANARASVVDALKRTPLPYAGFESVFNRQVTMDMCYPDEVCTQ